MQRSLKEAEAQSFQLYPLRWTRRSGRRRSCIRGGKQARPGHQPGMDRRGRMISGRPWRGGYSAPWSWMTPRKYVPYIRRLRESQNPWHQELLRRELELLVSALGDLTA